METEAWGRFCVAPKCREKNFIMGIKYRGAIKIKVVKEYTDKKC